MTPRPQLPPFPWDTLTPYAERARRHPDGIVNLSVGTPVDPTPRLVRDALAGAADAPGYPTTHGTASLREAVVDWFARRRAVPGLDPVAVLPTVGSKEMVAWLPTLLGLGPGDAVVHPEVAYPTYDVGARMSGATPVAADDVDAWRGRTDVRLVWVNSPSNPTGRVLGADALREVVDAARGRGALVVSDECYALLPWTEPWVSGGVPSVLDPRVNGGSLEGVLAVHSLSKQSNLAGYRAAFTAGDPAVVADLLEVRKHLGMMVPAPVQAATAAALADDAHVDAQRERYARRRAALLAALVAAGLQVEGSEAGLYLWARPAGGGQDCWTTVGDLADQGVLVAPGSFYGPRGAGHVRIALTASDDDVARACARLSGA